MIFIFRNFSVDSFVEHDEISTDIKSKVSSDYFLVNYWKIINITQTIAVFGTFREKALHLCKNKFQFCLAVQFFLLYLLQQKTM